MISMYDKAKKEQKAREERAAAKMRVKGSLDGGRTYSTEPAAPAPVTTRDTKPVNVIEAPKPK